MKTPSSESSSESSSRLMSALRIPSWKVSLLAQAAWTKQERLRQDGAMASCWMRSLLNRHIDSNIDMERHIKELPNTTYFLVEDYDPKNVNQHVPTVLMPPVAWWPLVSTEKPEALGVLESSTFFFCVFSSKKNQDFPLSQAAQPLGSWLWPKPLGPGKTPAMERRAVPTKSQPLGDNRSCQHSWPQSRACWDSSHTKMHPYE